MGQRFYRGIWHLVQRVRLLYLMWLAKLWEPICEALVRTRASVRQQLGHGFEAEAVQPGAAIWVRTLQLPTQLYRDTNQRLSR